MDQSKKTIFIADGNDTDLYKLEGVLESHYNTLTMPTAQKMFALLEKVTPYIILLDADIPDMNCFDVVLRLKYDSDYPYIPVMFLSESRNILEESKAVESGVVDFIFKPFVPNILLNRVKVHVNLCQMIRERGG